MEPVRLISGVAAPLPLINIDTDKIVPGPYLRTITRTGLAKALFEEMRYLDDGSPDPRFILNKPGYDRATILVAGDNFGCGSSREHAPWTLLDFGIRCVIAPSFADIFYGNSIKTGLLPVPLPSDVVDTIVREASLRPDPGFEIDLQEQAVRTPSASRFSFEIDASHREMLLQGLSDIELTLRRAAAITRFEDAHWQARPWLRETGLMQGS